MKTALLFELMTHRTCSPHSHGGFVPWSSGPSQLQSPRLLAPTFLPKSAQAAHRNRAITTRSTPGERSVNPSPRFNAHRSSTGQRFNPTHF